MSDPQGLRHPDVRALRALARDPHARAEAGACLLEGPRVILAALERGAVPAGVWFGHGAARAFPDIRARLDELDVPCHELKEGVLEKIGTTRTPQPVLAIASWEATTLPDLLAQLDRAGSGTVVVAVDVADPGNLGTILRSGEASGASGVVVAGDAVDVRNPKVIRASAGALFGIPVVEAADARSALAGLRAGGVRSVGAVARGGVDPAEVDLTGRIAVVVGNEARGIDATLAECLDGTVTIPMAGSAESLNVAMATTVLCFEAARQRARVAR